MENRKPMFVITATYGLFYIAFTSAFSFMATFLTGQGYSSSQVAQLFMLQSAISLFAGPALGYLADSIIPIKRIVLTLIACAIPAALLVPHAVGSWPVAVASVLLLSFFGQSLMSMIDSWTYMVRAHNPGIIYSVARGMGSFTSALTGFFVGRLMVQYGNAIIFSVQAAFLALAFGAALMFTSVPCPNRKKAEGEAGEGRISLLGAAKILSSNRKYTLLLLGLFFLGIGNRAVVSYLPVMIRDFGGTASDQGLSVFMLTIAIYPFMLIYPKILRRFGIHKILVAGVFFTFLRILTTALVNSLPVLIYMQLLEGIAFGLFNPSVIEYIAQIAPVKLRSSAIALAMAVQMAICGILGNLFASFFLQVSTLKMMYTIHTGLAVVGVAFVVLSARRKLPAAGTESPAAEAEAAPAEITAQS